MIGPRQALQAPIDGLGYPFVILVGLAALTLALNLIGTFSKDGVAWENLARRVFWVAIIVQILTICLFMFEVRTGLYYAPQYGESFEMHLGASPFLLTGAAAVLITSLAWEILSWKYDSIVAHLPDCAVLDNMIYKTVGVSFGLLTLMFAAGAFWANHAWGKYWTWDPKVIWSLVTWFIYAGYMDLRLTRGWAGRRMSYIAIIGFGIMIFTFLGVTYLLQGLHAYM